MSSDLPPFPEDVEKLLTAERGFPPLPGALEARLWAAISPQLPPVPALPHPPSAASALPHASSLAKLGVKWPLAVAFAMGGGAGAGVHAAIVRPQRVVQVVQVEAPSPAPAPTPTVDLVRTPKVSPPHPAKMAPIPSQHVAPEDPSLASERALLEMGRTALARGQNQAAYEAMVEHEQHFPHGQLAEERDAVRIQALVGLGQIDAARLLAESFRQTYPRSLLRAAIDRTVKDGATR